MAEVESPPVVVCDAGPLIHLDELGCLDLLCDFREVFVCETVWSEVARYRPAALRRRRVRLQLAEAISEANAEVIELARTFSLAAGEFESLCLMATLPHAFLLTDDAAARLVAGKLGYPVHGTIGVVVRSMRRGQRTKRQVKLGSAGVLFQRPCRSLINLGLAG